MKKIFAGKSISHLAITMCVLGAVFYCYEYYLRVAPSVMSAELKEVFGLGEASFGYLAACYYYAYTPMQIPVGIMMDRFGPRRILTFACFLCAFGTYLFASTVEITLAQVGRFLVGFGSAFAYVGVLKISSIWLPSKYFAMMAGLCTAMGMLGAIGGEVSMTYLVEMVGWRETLNYSVVVGLILTLLLWLVLRDGTQHSQDSQTESLSEVVHHQFNGIKEMIYSSQMWISGLIGCLTFLPITGFAEIWAVSFLQSTGMSKDQAAFGSSMVFLGFAIGGPIWGIISDLIQSRRIPLILGSFISAGLMALLVFFPSDSIAWMYTLLFFSAFFASVEIIIFAVSNDLSRPSVNGTAVSFINMFTMIGGALIPPIIGEILDSSIQLVDNMPVLTAADYSQALAVIPVGLLLSGILSIFLRESYRKKSIFG